MVFFSFFKLASNRLLRTLILLDTSRCCAHIVCKSCSLIVMVLRAVEGPWPAGALPEGDATSPSAHHDHDEDGAFASGKSKQWPQKHEAVVRKVPVEVLRRQRQFT